MDYFGFFGSNSHVDEDNIMSAISDARMNKNRLQAISVIVFTAVNELIQIQDVWEFVSKTGKITGVILSIVLVVYLLFSLILEPDAVLYRKRRRWRCKTGGNLIN